MFYGRMGYSGYYRDPRIRPNPDPYFSQEWARMYGYPEIPGANPYLLVSGKRRSRVRPVSSLPLPQCDPISPLYVRTSQTQPRPLGGVPVPRSGYEFYPSEYYSQYSSAFYNYPQPEVHGKYYHQNLRQSQG